MMYNGIPVEVLYLESAAAHSYAFFDIDESIWKFAGYYRLRANLILFDDQIPGQKLGVPEHQHCLYRFKWVGIFYRGPSFCFSIVMPVQCRLYYFPAQGEHLVELGFIYSSLVAYIAIVPSECHLFDPVLAFVLPLLGSWLLVS